MLILPLMLVAYLLVGRPRSSRPSNLVVVANGIASLPVVVNQSVRTTA